LDFRSTSPFVVGGLAGLPVAILLMHRLDADVFRNLFGAFLVLYTGWAMAGLLIRAVNAKRALAVAGGCPPALQAPRASRPSTWIARPALGFVAGIVGGMTAMPSAVVGVWADANGMSKDEFRRLVQPFILSMQVFALGMMATSSPSLWREIAPYLSISAGPLALGTICGLVCYKIADPTLFRVATLAIVFVAGCALSWA
jgi:uncharacterized membrane protein YfcA